MAGTGLRAVVLVEGASDQAALEILARRQGRDPASAGVRITAMNGATNLGHFIRRYGPAGLDVRLAGLYDVAEERHIRRGLRHAGLGADLSRDDLMALGFHVCTADLEDELIRALGDEQVERLVEAEGQIRSFRTLQRQPALREQPLHDQLRRLMSGRSGGKLRYARAMTEALGLAHIPRPLNAVLDHAYGA